MSIEENGTKAVVKFPSIAFGEFDRTGDHILLYLFKHVHCCLVHTVYHTFMENDLLGGILNNFSLVVKKSNFTHMVGPTLKII